MTRCEWVAVADPQMLRYHDEEWGVPSKHEVHVFEMLTLDGAQAGLSWSTILRKREGYRRAFAAFDVASVAAFGPDDLERLMSDPGIFRNRAKIVSTIDNARAALALRDEGSSLGEHLWAFSGGQPIRNSWRETSEIPTEAAESRAMSADLRRRGFRFVGPTICYALMQSIGIVNDHTVDCFRWTEVDRAR